MAQKVPVTIFIDEDQHIEAIRLRPLAAGLSTATAQDSVSAQSHATAKMTYSGGQTDAEADVTIDF